MLADTQSALDSDNSILLFSTAYTPQEHMFAFLRIYDE